MSIYSILNFWGKMENNHYDFIDSLRGIAILGVIMVHAVQFGRFNAPVLVFIAKLAGEGQNGVQLFYLVSAFTLFLSMENRINKEFNPIKNFFIRRFFRIAPMYYIAIAAFLVTFGFGPRYWLGDAQNITILNILSNMIFLHGFNPYWINSLVLGGWSIAVEMTFYCILPFLFSKIRTINHAIICFEISIVIRPILYMILIRFNPIGSDYLWGHYLGFYFPNQLPVFCLGIIMYFIVIKKQNLYDIKGETLFLLGLFCVFEVTIGKDFFAPHHIVVTLAFLLFAISISIYKNILAINPLFSYFGKISFSMYLVHYQVLIALTRVNFIDYAKNGTINFILRYIITVILTSIISTISYKIIELPFQNLGKRLINKMENKALLKRETNSV